MSHGYYHFDKPAIEADITQANIGVKNQQGGVCIYTKFSIVDVALDCGIYMKDPSCTEIRCRCPFCSNGRGKMTASINKDKGLFYCHRCGEGLNAITLYAKINGTNSSTAYKDLKDSAA